MLGLGRLREGDPLDEVFHRGGGLGGGGVPEGLTLRVSCAELSDHAGSERFRMNDPRARRVKVDESLGRVSLTRWN